MTLQLSIDDHIVQEARKVAESMGTSIDQLVRDYLERLPSSADIEAELEELERLSEEAKGDSRGWKFNRDDIYDL
jgi:antitoxin component of RelBE/YafQ-DinJ toxin-antitoxin module